MKPLATLINVVAFTALFVAYAGGGEIEKPDGVRRALQTYARESASGATPQPAPAWQIDIQSSDAL